MLEEGLLRSALVEVQRLKSDVVDFCSGNIRSKQVEWTYFTVATANHPLVPPILPSLPSPRPPSGHFPVQSPHLDCPRHHRLIASSSTTNRSLPRYCSTPATAIQQCYKHQFQPISSTSYQLSTRRSLQIGKA